MKAKDKKRIISYLLKDGAYHDIVDWAFRFFLILFNDIPLVEHREVRGLPELINKLKKEFPTERIFGSDTYNIRRSKNSHSFDAVLADYENKIITYSEYSNDISILWSADNSPKSAVKKYTELIKSHGSKPRKVRSKGKVFVLTIKGGGKNESLTFAPFKINPLKISIEQNYTDDFKPKSDAIIKRLNTNGDNGIAILHGEPGTGKTFYLKHLIKTLKKKILYVPPALVQYIVSPFFIKLLGRFKNSVLLIEDADNILRKRDEKSDIQDVSSLLNITDGLLHDVLNLQIVTTFNTDIRNIDEAFLRKGRLIAIHKFEKLPVQKSMALSKFLGFKNAITEPMTLSDIYNQNKAYFGKNKENGIGFKLKNETASI